jgi:hypothetical protein
MSPTTTTTNAMRKISHLKERKLVKDFSYLLRLLFVQKWYESSFTFNHAYDTTKEREKKENEKEEKKIYEGLEKIVAKSHKVQRKGLKLLTVEMHFKFKRNYKIKNVTPMHFFYVPLSS